ncbi:MAG: hypothetical protein ACD_81C00178G0004 [uncultured bacterium]|uniref:Uncharacterized protein n=2 Tax=Candidatus Wolfeibacteriota TaxID=1752735 RepID=A0A0G1JIU1_9BACT|nr:MAG: hypothetical protein ACD_81C00178G0004 [uncultured bacterium]KKR12970.1 MAG: hypothetical protein UT41_C0001G0514 [Candidatus Wolfebacteria bacterium GW2011_GWC2_39_22]KKT43897.1 MAG: hypothetical protein UW32_C0001G0489 [Candidatus Wolfebacteria bacterium GW2011_GWE2_44_13]HBI25377.1 hypothetical protein [Candidatus Wolfebacteria bacterium]
MATQRKVIIGGGVCGALMICGFIFMYTARLEESNKEKSVGAIKEEKNSQQQILVQEEVGKGNTSDESRKKDTQEEVDSISSPSGFTCEISSRCDINRLSSIFGVAAKTEALAHGANIVYLLPEGTQKAEQGLLMFPGTNGIACQFALKAQPIIEKALSEGIAVILFQAECPYCSKRQFRLEKSGNVDIEMVQDARSWAMRNLGVKGFVVYGFSEGAVFSMLVNDMVQDIRGVVVDAGFHPSQLKKDDGSGTCTTNFVSSETVNIAIKSPARILLNCGERDSICNKAQPKLYEQIKNTNQVRLNIFKNNPATSIDESTHSPHLDSKTIEEIFSWAYSL